MNTETVNGIQFTRIKQDTNGNPRYACHFMNLLNANQRGYTYDDEQFDATKPVLNLGLSEKYALAIKKANKIGGRKYHNKHYGGGIVFQSYNLRELADSIQQIANK